MNLAEMQTNKSQPSRSSRSVKNAAPVPIGGVPAQLKHIEAACGLFACEHAHLGVMVTRLNDRIRDLTTGHMPEIRHQAQQVATNRTHLVTLVDSNRSLFEKPRTRIFFDIKVGLKKQEGKIQFANEEATIALIEKHFPHRLEELAPAKRSLSKTALEKLNASELKRIACEISDTTDAIIIKPQDTDVEKAVAALLAEESPA